MYGSFSSLRVATSRFVGQWKIQKIQKIKKAPNNICNIIIHSNCCLVACITQWQNTKGGGNNNKKINNIKSEQKQKRVASEIANCNKVWNVKKKRSVQQTAIERSGKNIQITKKRRKHKKQNKNNNNKTYIATATNTIEKKKEKRERNLFYHFDRPTIF